MLFDMTRQGLTPLARTPDYTDDVLHSKISTLVYVVFCLALDSSSHIYQPAFCSSGAIRRLAVEKETTSSITYKNFVSDLDAGDAFTTTLVDILVKVGVYVPFLRRSNDLIINSNVIHPTGNRRQALKGERRTEFVEREDSAKPPFLSKFLAFLHKPFSVAYPAACCKSSRVFGYTTTTRAGHDGRR